ncbi:dihydrolipoamide acetyltransferase family protein [Sporolituus thermophilus]|uniref:Dihydrolipoamide acetyltransferase component of pyruvate dehydrogenase complex n=1 Tax=Sporolituus thermophilus DSM 23256 TaxID=1123285 RepID=A0A1G7L8J0_9FIRM|nr:dihydrolipoamide acetyltransferase family protein [Sporolituus thermophilus]SDF45339.1 pyruvate dehydrogenase E2 component (dihydrolipoamide acetyltransferase) [Sporolituus thermophilus DSM 23256]
MATQFTMPQLGLTMTEGTVTKWYKRVGETVRAGEVLAEISTDKITNQMEAPVDGVLLSIVVPEGQTVPVRTLLAVIGAPGEQVAEEPPAGGSAAKAAAASEPVPGASPAARMTGTWVKASPLARKIARQNGIDLALVTGTGPGGRVVARDVVNFLAQRRLPVKATPLAVKVAAEHGIDLAAMAKPSRLTKADVLAALPVTEPRPPAAPAGQPLAGMRKIIAERMSLSWQTAPHVHLTVEVDMTAVLALKAQLAKVTGEKFSVTEFVIKAAAQGLAEFPAVNARLEGGCVVMPADVNIGVAVALDNGLIVPVIRQADKQSLRALRAAVAALSDKARRGALTGDEIGGGTFTVTNLGMYGVDHFTPIINPPESAILGVCRVADRPVAADGQVVVRPMANLCLGFDHRLIDGAVAAKFMARLRQLLEQPLLLLV